MEVKTEKASIIINERNERIPVHDRWANEDYEISRSDFGLRLRKL